MGKSPDLENGELDGNGLPWPDAKLFEDWRAEAMQTAPTAQEWADLIACIRLAAEQERQGYTNKGLPDGMTAPERCLNAIIVFLQNRPGILTRGDTAPLLRLQSAIVDLEQGRVSSLFTPVKKQRGNPGKGQIYQTLQGLAARTLSELIEGGENAKSAARRVEKALRKGRKDMKDVEAKSVENWREHLNLGPGPGAPDTALLHYRMPLPPNYGDNAKARGENLLKMLELTADFIG